MEKDLKYYRRRRAEEQVAEDSATHPAVRAAHHGLVAGYSKRIAGLKEHESATELHLVRAV